MRNRQIQRMVLAAMLAALCCVATLVIQVPSPMSGYVNLGDGVVLLSGWILGPAYGFAAAGLGSAMADVFSGYTHYAAGTFLIKGFMAVIAYYLAAKCLKKRPSLGRALGAAAAECWMVAGYFGYACLILGKGLAAAASIPGNWVQGIFGLAVALVAAELLIRSKRLKGVMHA